MIDTTSDSNTAEVARAGLIAGGTSVFLLEASAASRCCQAHRDVEP